MAGDRPFGFGGVRFEENHGQADAAVRYIARTRGQQVFLTDRGVVFSQPDGVPARMDFVGSSAARWTPIGAAGDSISYYIGNNPGKWVKEAPQYGRVVWRGVYPGVDLALYGHEDRLEYDLIFAPGADPSRVRIRFGDGARVRSKADGTLEISAGGSMMWQRAPAIYQELTPGKRTKVEGRFVVAAGNSVRLKIGPYRPSKELVVDPVIEAS